MCIKSILRRCQRCTPLACALCGIVGDPCRASATCTASAGPSVQTTVVSTGLHSGTALTQGAGPLMYQATLNLQVPFLSAA